VTIAMSQEAGEIVTSAEGAKAALERGDWGIAERLLTEAQERIARLLREVGDKSREMLMAPKPDQGDRG
jgi:hypothetical protein